MIPDRPRFDINVTPGTTIALDLNVEWGEGLENSQSYQTTQFDSARDSETKFTSAVGGFHASMEEWIGLKVGVSAEVGLTGMSATVDTTVYGGIDVTAGAHGTATTGTGESGRRESRRTMAQVRDAGRTRNQRVSGGRIAATFDVVNTGNLAFTLTDLSLGVTRWDTNTRSTKPLTTMQAGNAQATLAPGERTTVFFEDDDLPADRVMDVMADPSSLSFTPVAFGIERSEGVDLDFVDEDILLRTAHVVISYADGTSDVFDRASDIRRDALGNPIGLTIREVLAEAGVPAESRDTPSGVIVYDINGIPSTEYTEDPEPLPYAVEERWLETGWFVLLHRDGRNGELPDDRLDTPLRAGDQATLVQITDLDRDGLTSWHEAQYGTSDLAIDSDGDGHSDVEELFVEHLIGEDPDNPGTLIYGHSDPAAVDADGDGLSDDEELNWCLPFFFGLEFCLNPLDADTDGDGIDDFTEVRDWIESPWDAVNVNFITPPSAECVYTRVTQHVNGVEFECRHTQLIISDPGFDLVEVRTLFGRRPWLEFVPMYGLWLDVPGSEISVEYAPMDVSVTGLLTVEDLLTPEHLAIMRAPQSCEQTGYVSVTAVDYTGLTTQLNCSWGGVW